MSWDGNERRNWRLTTMRLYYDKNLKGFMDERRSQEQKPRKTAEELAEFRWNKGIPDAGFKVQPEIIREVFIKSAQDDLDFIYGDQP